MKLDSKLNFQSQVKTTIKGASFRVFLLRKLAPMFPIQAALIIYKVTILTQIDYACIFYDANTQTLLQTLRRIHNKALKICVKLPILTSTEEIHSIANINQLKKRRTILILKYAYNFAVTWITMQL